MCGVQKAVFAYLVASVYPKGATPTYSVYSFSAATGWTGWPSWTGWTNWSGWTGWMGWPVCISNFGWA